MPGRLPWAFQAIRCRPDAGIAGRIRCHNVCPDRLRRLLRCLTAGPESDRTFEPTHRWRTLAVQRCNHADPTLSRWEFVVPKASMR